jgi:hypothetical protein
VVTEQTPQNKSALGLTFMALGVAFTVTFGIIFGPAFIGIGVPFIVLGIIFLNRNKDGEGAVDE